MDWNEIETSVELRSKIISQLFAESNYDPAVIDGSCVFVDAYFEKVTAHMRESVERADPGTWEGMKWEVEDDLLHQLRIAMITAFCEGGRSWPSFQDRHAEHREKPKTYSCLKETGVRDHFKEKLKADDETTFHPLNKGQLKFLLASVHNQDPSAFPQAALFARLLSGLASEVGRVANALEVKAAPVRTPAEKEEGGQNLKETLDQLAELEHQQWAHWTAYMLDTIEAAIDPATMGYEYEGTTAHAYSGSRIVQRIDAVKRWRRQIETPYEELTDKEKASDMEWAVKAYNIKANCRLGPSWVSVDIDLPPIHQWVLIARTGCVHTSVGQMRGHEDPDLDSRRWWYDRSGSPVLYNEVYAWAPFPEMPFQEGADGKAPETDEV